MRTSKNRSRAALVERLCRAKERQEMTRVLRVQPGAERIDGYVVAVGAKWFLMADTHETGLDGYVALRLRDVERVWRDRDHDLMRRMLAHQGGWPVAGPSFTVDLDTTAALVRTASAGEAVVTVLDDTCNPDMGFVGAPRYVDDRSFLLVEVSNEGGWDDELSRWWFRDITRVDFGGPYERLLTALAGPVPEPWNDPDAP